MGKIYCTNCGAENDDSVRFCASCGAELDKSFLGKDDEAGPEEDAASESEQPHAERAEGPDTVDETLQIPVPQTRFVEDETRVIAGSGTPSGSSAGPDTTGFDRIGTDPSQAGPVFGASSPSTPITPPPAQPTGTPAPASQPPSGQPTPPAPRSNTGAVVGITLGIVAAVFVVAFGLFYFLNPLGLTTGIFANSAAAQAEAAAEAQAAAEQAQAEADEKQAQLEKAQAEADKKQKELEEAQKAQAEAEEKVQRSSSSSSSSSSGSSAPSTSSSSQGAGPTINGMEFVHHTYPASSSEYMLPDSADRIYSQDELERLSNWELYVGRNEIFARYGRRYSEGDLNSHFQATDWYMPLYDGGEFDEVPMEEYLNKNEYENVIQMRDIERARDSEYL